MIIRSEIIDEARKWINVRFRHQGRTKDGIDCVGLIIQVAKGLKISEFDITSYSRGANSLELIKFFKDLMNEKLLSEMTLGDVLVFRESAYPCHIAIIGEQKGIQTIIHAYAPRRKVVEERYEGEWKEKVTHCFEIPGVEPWVN